MSAAAIPIDDDIKLEEAEAQLTQLFNSKIIINGTVKRFEDELKEKGMNIEKIREVLASGKQVETSDDENKEILKQFASILGKKGEKTNVTKEYLRPVINEFNNLVVSLDKKLKRGYLIILLNQLKLFHYLYIGGARRKTHRRRRTHTRKSHRRRH